ncbi:iron-containing alcohol dehydrogenase [Halobacillus mangrovi]|uniref:Alcohol dehydrogenase n=1 Tax=Halobacillus mangrovi TaxID=402384 RepID=A0A1W5ZZF1_9BACI|nr:iron-containing alcohol dehydrogenase [Halobacillus mangrovi]ARI78621.1 alcohol dehydrogenase [Halobacillus mangrovi]
MYQFVSPKKVYYGEGSLSRLQDVLQELKVHRVFVVADPALKDLQVIDPIIHILEGEGVEVTISTDVVPEPSLNVGNQMVEQARESQAELVVGVGGGSALDLAKAAAVFIDNKGGVEDFLNLSGQQKFESRGVPKVLIPTTSGTGAEVTDISVFSLEDTKDVMTHPYLLADYAIIDPVMTYTLPPNVTASSGMDALTHAIEAYTSKHATPLTDSLALEAIGRISRNIRSAVWNDRDYKAREQMALGSMQAGLSFYNAGVAGVHALAYPLGGLHKVPHGESNAVLLPFVYDSIFPACLDKMAGIGKALGVPVEGKTNRQVAQSVVRYLLELVEDVGLPTTLSVYDIEEKDMERLVDNGLQQTRLLKRSPKPLSETAVRQIYFNALRGELTHS